MVRTLLGDSRYLVILGVLSSFLASLALEVFGVLRAAGIVIQAIQHGTVDDAYAKDLIVSSVTLIDIVLLGTVFFIIAVGLFELFVDDLPLPGWLHFRTLDDLKGRLTAVIVVALLVAFLGYALDWRGGWDILAPGLSIAAVILATGAVFRFLSGEGTGPPGTS